MFCAFLICFMLDTRIALSLLIAVVTLDEEYYVKFKSSHYEVFPPSCNPATLLMDLF
jgi:hypothetical protein